MIVTLVVCDGCAYEAPPGIPRHSLRLLGWTYLADDGWDMCARCSGLRECGAGREIIHPDRPSWRTPCPAPGEQGVGVDGHAGAAARLMLLCAEHAAELEREGLITPP